MKTWITIAAASLLALVVSCRMGDGGDFSSDAFFGQIWVVDRVADVDQIPDSAAFFLVLGPNSARGRAVCNSYLASVSWRPASHISFSGIGQAKMYCGEDINRIEESYRDALQSTDRFALDQKELTFFDRNGRELLHYHPGSPSDTIFRVLW